MKEVKLIVDGKEITAKISNDDIKMINNEVKTGYERVKSDEDCYHVYDDQVEECYEDCYGNNDEIYMAGNYYNDEQLALDVARVETLMRQLRRWQALNDEPMNWNTMFNKYCLYFDYLRDTIKVTFEDECRDFGQIYFSSEEKAEEALAVFHDELMWYFTKYQQRLDEPKHD